MWTGVRAPHGVHGRLVVRDGVPTSDRVEEVLGRHRTIAAEWLSAATR